jgi:5'-nucleotidase
METSMKKVVALDCDDVLVDFLGRAIDEIYLQYGIVVDDTEFVTFEYETVFDKYGIDADLFWNTVEQQGDGVHSNLELLDGAVEGYKQLVRRAEVFVVTAPFKREKNWINDRNYYLNKHFGIAADRIIHTSHKYLIRADILVDDKLQNLVDWHKNNPNGLPILFTAPHNLEDTTFQRVNNWEELTSLLNEVLE